MPVSPRRLVAGSRLILPVALGAVLAAAAGVPARADEDPPPTRREHVLVTPDPARGALVIGNRGSGPLRLRLASLNERRFFHDLADLQAEVDAVPTGPETPSLAARIWHVVKWNRRHDFFLTDRWHWFLSPPLFFNSSGVALCGEAAILTWYLAQARGIPAVLRGLNGHIVVELFEDGRWKMFDADYGVFFLTRQGQVASVWDLERDPTLITDPELRLQTFWPWDPYSEGYAWLYTTRDNFPMLPPAPTVDPGPLEFDLPPHARILFPGRFAAAPPDYYGVPLPLYGNLALVVPQGFTGPLRMPLILHTLRGSGRVLVQGQVFEVGSPELQAEIELRRDAGHDIEVIEARSDLEILFLMNPVRWQLRRGNTLAYDVLSGSDAWVGAARLGAAGADSDDDGIPDDGDASGVVGDRPCADRETSGCDDNCTFAPNPVQGDGDLDRAGNACDGDLGGDGFVDGEDARRLLWCRVQASDPDVDVPGCTGADLDDSGSLDGADENLFVGLFGREPSPNAAIEEEDPACGLGFELVAVLAPLGALARARSRSRGRGAGAAPAA
jgi:hypothetical protein